MIQIDKCVDPLISSFYTTLILLKQYPIYVKRALEKIAHKGGKRDRLNSRTCNDVYETHRNFAGDWKSSLHFYLIKF